MLEQASQKGRGCSFPGDAQDHVGWGPGQYGLVLNVEVDCPDCGRGVRAS